MAAIRYILDKLGGVVYPITHERSVRDSNGITLETKLGQKQNVLESGVNIKTINGDSILGEGNIILSTDTEDCEHLENKTTVISSESTNTQYPGAKAVYDAISDATQNLVSYPSFSINSNMHLIMASPDADSLSLFSVDSSGHLLMTV